MTAIHTRTHTHTHTHLAKHTVSHRMLQHIPICSEAATLAVKGCGSEWPFHSLKISLCGQLNVNADKWEVSECWFTGNASHVSHVKCNRCLHLFRVHFKCHLLVVSAVAVAALVMFSLLDYSIYNMCPRVRLIATPCCTVHNKSNTVLPPPHPLSFPRLLVPYLHLTSARPVSASAWGIAPRGANANRNRQAKALKGKKDSDFDGQSQIGMDKLKIAQLICLCVDSIIVCPSHSRPETQLKRRI